MSLHAKVIDALITAGVSQDAIRAACWAQQEVDDAKASRKRKRDAEYQDNKRTRDRAARRPPDLFERPCDDESRYADAAIADCQKSQTDSSDKRNPHKENTSSLRSSEVKNYATTPARELEPLVSAEAHEMAEAIGREAGFEPKDTPPGWCGAANMIQAFMTQGISAQHLRTAATTVLRRRTVSGRGPPENFAYFRKPLAEICGDLRTPVPKVAERNLEVIHGGKDAGARAWRNDGHSRNYGSATDAASDLRRYFAQRAEEIEREEAGNDRRAIGASDGGIPPRSV